LSREAALEELAQRIRECRNCRLHRSRKNAVPGEGNPYAHVMFVGEAPGYNEDVEGRPFVGAAGKLLTSLIESAGLSRGEVYITNVVKCRPPENRDPEADEIEACKPFLLQQLRIIRPAVVVSLGRHSTGFFFQLAGLDFRSVMSVRGAVRTVNLGDLSFSLLPTLHPAAALYNPGLKALLESDFKLLHRVLKPRRGDLTDWLG